MDELKPLGTRIAGILAPTAKIYGKLLARNADAIKKTKRTSHQYGPNARHELDVYYPADETSHDEAPVLIFVHGGGFIRGDRIVPSEPVEGLVYTNLGHYFAEECGYITVVMTYRLVFAHGAKFPTGGEDVGLAVKWVKENLSLEGQPRDLFIMGHSAGGVHLSTWLLAPAFENEVLAVTGNLKRQPVKLRGVILLATPLHYRDGEKDRAKEMKEYYGDRPEEDAPLGLLKDFQSRHGSDWPLGGMEMLTIDTELDPDNEIRNTTTDFLGQWLSAGSPAAMKDRISYRELEGHNHLSPVWSLGTGIEKEELWGEEVSGFIESIRRRDQLQKDIKILQDSIKYMPTSSGAAKKGTAPKGTSGEGAKPTEAAKPAEAAKSDEE